MTLYELRKKYQKKYETAPDANTLNLYRNFVIELTGEINEIESRVSQLKKEIPSRGRMGKVLNGERISELRGVLGK